MVFRSDFQSSFHRDKFPSSYSPSHGKILSILFSSRRTESVQPVQQVSVSFNPLFIETWREMSEQSQKVIVLSILFSSRQVKESKYLSFKSVYFQSSFHRDLGWMSWVRLDELPFQSSFHRDLGKECNIGFGWVPFNPLFIETLVSLLPEKFWRNVFQSSFHRDGTRVAVEGAIQFQPFNPLFIETM